MGVELSTADYQKMAWQSRAAAEKTHTRTKRIQLQKLGKLLGTERRSNYAPEARSMGSDRPFSYTITEGVATGVKFRTGRLTKFSGGRHCSSGGRCQEVEDLHGRVCGILRRVKLRKGNLTTEQRRTLKELKQMDTAILPADKGNATVLMANEDYNTKMKGDYHFMATKEGLPPGR